MKKIETSASAVLSEALGAVMFGVYIGIQIYFAMTYDVRIGKVLMNLIALALIYMGLSVLSFYPERVNGLPKEICSGKIRSYTVWMVRLVKLIFTGGILFASICDALGYEIEKGYHLVVAVLILLAVIVCEVRIIRILRNNRK